MQAQRRIYCMTVSAFLLSRFSFWSTAGNIRLHGNPLLNPAVRQFIWRALAEANTGTVAVSAAHLSDSNPRSRKRCRLRPQTLPA